MGEGLYLKQLQERGDALLANNCAGSLVVMENLASSGPVYVRTRAHACA